MELVVHGHFYQPPREDPWSGEVPAEFGAAPDHDWNERINAECYRPNALARVYEHGRLERWHNNYAALSFDLGPTLGVWLDRHDPLVLRRLAAADRQSRERLGWGNALAHPYYHSILPLCDPLDRATLVRWGLVEFRHRFGREPQGMWLPETAVDNATLATLVEHGIAFTVLAPSQASRPVETGRPYWWRHPDGSGRGLAIFFFDGVLAHEVAFGSALASTASFLAALEAARRRAGDGLVHLAVDGETFGHHQRFGERVLAHALCEDLPRRGARVTNYGAHLERNPPREEVEIDLGPFGEGSAWSCAHGVGRWRRDCGCRMRAETRQGWREPLRAALDLLRQRGRAFYLEQAAPLLADPWAARDAWIEAILVPTPRRVTRVLGRYGEPDLDGGERQRVEDLMAMQRHLLAMDTSCGWFFDDIAGLESQLVLRHAARAFDLWESLGGEGSGSTRADVLDILAAARSNSPPAGTGADVFRRHAGPAARERPGPPLRRPLLAALRRWLREAGRGGAAAVLDTIAAGVEARELERAQELFAAGLATDHRPPGAAEIAQALGFGPKFLAALADAAVRSV